jgi:hypothetical protein
LASLHDAQHHHGHRFHHIGTALEIMDHDEEEANILADRPWWLDVKPHVSSVMNKSAKKHFDMWAADYYFDLREEKKRIKRESELNAGPVPRRSLSQTTDDTHEMEGKKTCYIYESWGFFFGILSNNIFF